MLLRVHWSEKTDSSISLEYQNIHTTERTVRMLGENPTNNIYRNTLIVLQAKEVIMKKFKFNFMASWALALSIFVGAGGAQDICARSNVSFIR